MDPILHLLRENARLSNDEIAAQLGRAPAEVAAAVAELETSGLIRGYQAIINEDALGEDSVTAVIEVKVAPEREGGFDHIASRISRYPEVSSMYLMSGQYDLLVFVEGKSLKTVASFVSEKLASIPGVNGFATHFRLKTYKHHGVLMQNESSHERLQVSP